MRRPPHPFFPAAGNFLRNVPEDRGFTLLEVLVALVILGMAFVSIFQLFSADLRAIHASDDYSIAVMRAESRMREVLDDGDLSERAWSEVTADGYRIDFTVSDAEKERSETLPVQLLEITLHMMWTKDTREREFTLKTMKLVKKKI